MYLEIDVVHMLGCQVLWRRYWKVPTVMAVTVSRIKVMRRAPVVVVVRKEKPATYTTYFIPEEWMDNIIHGRFTGASFSTSRRLISRK